MARSDTSSQKRRLSERRAGQLCARRMSELSVTSLLHPPKSRESSLEQEQAIEVRADSVRREQPPISIDCNIWHPLHNAVSPASVMASQ